MSKKIILAIGILFLLVIAGCEGGNVFGKRQKNERPMTDADVRKGISGLTMQFVKNAPPENVFEESGFPVSLKLKNEGASDIEDNKGTIETESGIVVFGFEKSYADVIGKIKDEIAKLSDEEKRILSTKVVNIDEIRTLSDKKQEDLSADEKDKIQQFIDVLTNLRAKKEFNIKGKSIYSPLGDEDFININANAKKIGAQSEKHPSTILATACYRYKTILGTSVCIDPDVIGVVTGKKACAIKELAFSEGQGAPVTVTKIETRMLPAIEANKVKPHFIIFIANKGNGEVINPNKDKEDIIKKACTSKPLNYTDFNTLKITASLPQGVLKCSETQPAGPTTVRLKEKEDMIRCTLDEGIDIGRDAYTAPLRIELEYGYTFTISKDIIIEKVLKY